MSGSFRNNGCSPGQTAVDKNTHVFQIPPGPAVLDV